jgi:transcriptional regulator with XRE-family HTH domain
MNCNRGKLVEFRTKQALTQEALAGKAKINVRTVQRAEAGWPIDLQTIQEIASALGVTPSELLAERENAHDETSSDDAFDGEKLAVRLRLQSTARGLLETLADCLDARLNCAADLDARTVEGVTQFCEVVRPVLPELCPEYPFDQAPRDEASRLIHRITVGAAINDSMAKLRELGLAVFAGSFVDYQQIPRWDNEENCWATRTNQRLEPLKIALVTIGSSSESHLMVRVRCNPIPF